MLSVQMRKSTADLVSIILLVTNNYIMMSDNQINELHVLGKFNDSIDTCTYMYTIIIY